MKRTIAAGLGIAAILLLNGCSDASDYERTCIMKNDTVRGDCDKPGQSDESNGYQPH